MKTSKLAALTSGIVLLVAILLPASANIDCGVCNQLYGDCLANGGTIPQCTPAYYRCLRDNGCEIP